MNIANNKRSGFSAVISIITIVLVVGVIGFIGWRLYSQHSSTKTNDVTTGSTNTPASKESTSPTAATIQPTYLDIKELGVKIQLDDSIKDAVYSYHIGSDGSQYVYLSTQSLTTVSNGSCSDENGGLVSITKATGTPQQVFAGRPFQVDNTTVFKFDSDTYVFIGGRQATCSDSKTVENLANQQEATFFKDFKTLQPDQSNAYLDIKELGIKIPLGVTIHDLTYTYSNLYGRNDLRFSTKSIETADPTCTENTIPIGSYTIYTSQQPDPGIADNQAGAFVAHVNGYYIYAHEPQAPCGNSAASNLSSTLVLPLFRAVQGAQAQ